MLQEESLFGSPPFPISSCEARRHKNVLSGLHKIARTWESTMKTKRVSKTAHGDEGMLVSLARTVGSTLGAVAAKAEGLSKPARRRTVSKKSGAKANKARKKSRT